MRANGENSCTGWVLLCELHANVIFAGTAMNRDFHKVFYSCTTVRGVDTNYMTYGKIYECINVLSLTIRFHYRFSGPRIFGNLHISYIKGNLLINNWMYVHSFALFEIFTFFHFFCLFHIHQARFIAIEKHHTSYHITSLKGFVRFRVCLSSSC